MADSADLDAWLERTGHCVAGSSWRASGSYRRHDRATVVGLAGEMGRCYYWREHDRLDQGLSNEAILDRLHLPQSPLLLERCDEWKAHAQAPDTAALIDLLFLEQRLSCWACPLLYGRIGGREAILPFNHRENLDAMLRLPVEYRTAGLLPFDLIRSRWPSLLRIPFNKYTGVRALRDNWQQKYWHFYIQHPNVAAQLRLPAPRLTQSRWDG